MAESSHWNRRRPCVVTAVLALQLFITMLPPTSSCPTSCVCKWKGGKQTVECLNKGLAAIPDGMDTGTQVLEFSGNNLQVLGRDRFLRAGLLHLQRIYVSRCRLGSIDDHAFRGLANLVELDLSDNLLSRLPSPTTFADFPSLMRLSLSNNPIRRIPSRAFYPLTSLVTLEMSGCEVENIEEMAFSGLDSLEWLKLDGNRLRTIGGTGGAGASAILPASLHGVDLHHNPWHCDCRLLGLRSWLLRYNIPHSIEPRCNTPVRLATKPVKSLPPHDLACLPDVSPTAMFLEIAEGRNASLLCRVSAIPDATVSWWFRGRILQNATLVAPGLHLYYFLEEVVVPGGSAPPSSAGQEKRSELFIINANAAEGNGTYACVAENAAGAAQSNYTVRIVVREERGEGVEMEAASTAILPPEYAVVVISAGVAALVLLVALSATVAALALRCRRKRRRRRKKERSKAAAALTDHGKVSSVEGGSVVGGCIVSASGRSLDPGGCGVVSRDAGGGPGGVGGTNGKANGTIITPQNRLHHEMTMMGASASVVLANTGMGHRQRHSGVLSCSGQGPNGGGERNPDLINDTTGGADSEGCKERLREAGDGEEKVDEDGVREEEQGNSGNSGPNSYQEAMENVIEEFSEDGKVRSIATSPVGQGGPGLRLLRDVPPTCGGPPKAPYGRGGQQQQRAPTAYRYVHPQHFHQHTADVHLSPGRFLDSDGYPIDYGLPKIPHPPMPLSLPLVPMPPLNAAPPPQQGDHSAFYRTLPHRRAAPPTAAPRYSRDAEYYPVALVGGVSGGGSSSYEPPGAVRYQREGYPYSSPPTTVTPPPPPSYPSTPGANSNGDGVAFSPGDPAFLPSPPAAYKGGDSPGEDPGMAAPPCCGGEDSAQGPPMSPPGGGGGGGAHSRSLGLTSGGPAHQPPTLQESPDEGYEDDGTEI